MPSQHPWRTPNHPMSTSISTSGNRRLVSMGLLSRNLCYPRLSSNHHSGTLLVVNLLKSSEGRLRNTMPLITDVDGIYRMNWKLLMLRVLLIFIYHELSQGPSLLLAF